MQLYLVMKLDVVLNHLNISHRNVYVMFCLAENVNTITSLINQKKQKNTKVQFRINI